MWPWVIQIQFWLIQSKIYFSWEPIAFTAVQGCWQAMSTCNCYPGRHEDSAVDVILWLLSRDADRWCDTDRDTDRRYSRDTDRRCNIAIAVQGCWHVMWYWYCDCCPGVLTGDIILWLLSNDADRRCDIVIAVQGCLQVMWYWYRDCCPGKLTGDVILWFLFWGSRNCDCRDTGIVAAVQGFCQVM